MKYTEDTLTNWTRSSTDTEEQKINNALNMIKDAINSNDELSNKDIEVFSQGSYANNTNVRLESDIDVCIMLKDTFYREYPEGVTREDYGFTPGTNNFDDYKTGVVSSLVNKFSSENINIGNKSIKIHSNTYRVDADVVSAFQYRNYINDRDRNPENFTEGIKFFSTQNEEIINYPKIHISNGIYKNGNTQRRFKRLVRILKRIRYKMEEDNLPISSGITSFLIECLIWNVPNDVFNDYYSWNEILRQAIIVLYNDTKNNNTCEDWGEVSEEFYLFHSGRKWNRGIVNSFLTDLWNYLEYN